MDGFTVIEELARGKKGNVYKVRHKESGELYVLKERRSAELGRGKSILNEVVLLRKVKHPCLVELISYFWDAQVLYMQLEYAEYGDLHSEICKRRKAKKPFTDSTLCQMFLNLTRGLAHLHQSNIIHRDIKTMNVFLFGCRDHCLSVKGVILGKEQERFCLKIGDLGVSRECSTETLSVSTFCGTPIFASPEICDNVPYSYETDIWSLGTLFYEAVALRHAFQVKSLPALAAQISRVEYDALPETVSRTFRLLVDGMLKKIPGDRLSLEAIIAKLQQFRPTQKAVCEKNESKVKQVKVPSVLHKHDAKKPQVVSPKAQRLGNKQADAKFRRLETDLRRKRLRLKTLSAWDNSSREIEQLKKEIAQLMESIALFGTTADGESCYYTAPLPEKEIISEEHCRTSVKEGEELVPLKKERVIEHPAPYRVKQGDTKHREKPRKKPSPEETDYANRLTERNRRLELRRQQRLKEKK